MRGVGINEFGGPEVLEIVELDEVHAGPGQVRIKVFAATVNPTDTIHRSGDRAEALRKDPPPYIAGMDVAGVIDEIGPDTATALSVGDAVMAMVVPDGTHGAYREQIVLAANAVARQPVGLSHVEAATLPMNALTAWKSLDQLALAPGSTLAVTGAAGCYGGYVVQLAKARGIRVIADSSEADQALVQSLGADVIVERGPAVAAAIRAVEPDGVDGLADGSLQMEAVVPAVRDGGGFASVRGWEGNGERDIAFHQTWVRRYDGRADLIEEIAELVEQGLVTARVAGAIPAEQAAEAHRRLEAGGTRGRFVLTF